MKKAKFADKITDLVEETLVSMGQSDPFTVYDNLDDEFSFTLEHDVSHRTINYDLEEIYHTKQEEDVKVKDLYRIHVKGRVEGFVNECLELMRSGRYGEIPEEDHEEDDEYDDEEDYYDDDVEEEDEDEIFNRDFEVSGSFDDEPSEDLGESFYDNDAAFDSDMIFSDQSTGMDYAVFEEKKDEKFLNGVKITPAKDVLPAFLREERFSDCVFVEYSRDKARISAYQMDEDVFEAIKDQLNGKEPYVVLLDDFHLMCVVDDPAYLQIMLKKMTESGVNIKDDEVYRYDSGSLTHVFSPDGRQINGIVEEVDMDDLR